MRAVLTCLSAYCRFNTTSGRFVTKPSFLESVTVHYLGNDNTLLK